MFYRLCILTTAFLVLFAGCLTSAEAKTFTYPDLNFTCTTPEGWNCDHKIGDNVHAYNPAKTKSFCLRAYKADVTTNQLAVGEERMKAYLAGDGFTATNRAPLMLRGVSFDTFMVIEKSSTQTFRLDIYVGLVRGFIYELDLSMYDGIPSTDPELKSIVDSFEFLTPPLPPLRGRPPQYDPPSAQPAVPSEMD